MEGSAFFWVWLFFRALFIGLLLIFLISGLDDLLIDLLYYSRMIFRKLFRRKVIKPVTLEQLSSVPEKTAAIIVPAWDEKAVILRMLLNTVATVDYKNYHIFVGTYPNDEETKMEVEKAREIYPNIDVIVTPSEGPTNKADCLNWIFQGIRVFEKDYNTRFDFFIMHDAEDIIHPLSLKYYNYLIPRVHFIQIPVFPFDVKWTHVVTGIYMDEFAESHTKNLRIRELIATSLPSAGVGTALSREVLDYLSARNKNQVFDISSLTEDYMMGIRLHDFSGKKIFLQQNVSVPSQTPASETDRPVPREPLATREYFPTSFKAAVRQKARWILGISLQGWDAGWTKSLGQNYFLFRDRKSVMTNLAVVLGYVVVAYSIIDAAIRRSTSISVPPLIEANESYILVLKIVLCMFVWRLLNRVASSWRIYGPLQGALAIPRLFMGNILNFCATCAGIKRFIAAKISGTVPEWGKTEHAFPTENQLRGYRRRLGDLLLDHHFITTAQLEEALKRQKKSGKRLGDILVNMGALWEEDLIQTLAVQNNEIFVEIDPYLTSTKLLELVPQTLAEKYHIFPLRMEGDTIVLAADNLDVEGRKEEMERALGIQVSLAWSSTIDIEFALKRAYTKQEAVSSFPSRRLGEKLVNSGRLSEELLTEALRRQKRTNKKLGEVLIEMGNMTTEDVQAALNEPANPNG